MREEASLWHCDVCGHETPPMVNPPAGWVGVELTELGDPDGELGDRSHWCAACAKYLLNGVQDRTPPDRSG